MHKFIRIRNQYIFNICYKSKFVELLYIILGGSWGEKHVDVYHVLKMSVNCKWRGNLENMLRGFSILMSQQLLQTDSHLEVILWGDYLHMCVCHAEWTSNCLYSYIIEYTDIIERTDETKVEMSDRIVQWPCPKPTTRPGHLSVFESTMNFSVKYSIVKFRPFSFRLKCNQNWNMQQNNGLKHSRQPTE